MKHLLELCCWINSGSKVLTFFKINDTYIKGPLRWFDSFLNLQKANKCFGSTRGLQVKGSLKCFSALGWDKKGRAGARPVWEELDAVGAAQYCGLLQCSKRKQKILLQCQKYTDSVLPALSTG